MTAHTHVELRPGAYADSVTLLQVSRAVQDLDGVEAAQVAMATALNLEVLVAMGFEVPAEAGGNDMVVAQRGALTGQAGDDTVGGGQLVRGEGCGHAPQCSGALGHADAVRPHRGVYPAKRSQEPGSSHAG